MISVDLFAGLGGLTLGLEQAGIRAGLCVDLSEAATQTLLRAGLPAQRLNAQDPITDLVSRVKPDLICGGPPCQPYSRSGKRMASSDPRDCIPAMMRIVQAVNPTWVLIENVVGATERIQSAANELMEQYRKVSIMLLDAADYGVPQRRRRVFLVAGPVQVETPKPSARWVGMGDALGISEESPGEGLIYPKGLGRAGTEPWRLKQPSPTVMTTEVKGTRANARSGWTFNGGPDRASDALFLALGRRRATLRECKILQGLDPSMKLCGTIEDQYRLIGNAVPPPLARAIGQEIVRAHWSLR